MVEESPEGGQHRGPHHVNLLDQARAELGPRTQVAQLTGDGRDHLLVEGGYPGEGGRDWV